jgi:hypothetical protein
MQYPSSLEYLKSTCLFLSMCETIVSTATPDPESTARRGSDTDNIRKNHLTTSAMLFVGCPAMRDEEDEELVKGVAHSP